MNKRISLKDITPTAMSCAAIGCPAIYETNDESYVIIGKIATQSIIEKLNSTISEGEVAVIVPRNLMANLATK